MMVGDTLYVGIKEEVAHDIFFMGHLHFCGKLLEKHKWRIRITGEASPKAAEPQMEKANTLSIRLQNRRKVAINKYFVEPGRSGS
jgi:hypothetical protein